MKRTVLITVLAVLLLSVFGPTAVMASGQATTALSCEGPSMPSPFVGHTFQINGSLTDGMSGAPIPDKAITVYMLTDGKKWMEVGSDSTDEYGQYNVTTRQDTADTYSYKAVFDGDKIFRKVTSPTGEVRVNSMPKLGPIAFINYLELHNNGWFAAKLACYYSTDHGVTWTESSHTGAIGMTSYAGMPLYAYGVPDGAWVKIHAIVVGGNDKTGSTVFEYYRGNSNMPNLPIWTYYISGTTLNPKLDGPYDGNP